MVGRMGKTGEWGVGSRGLGAGDWGPDHSLICNLHPSPGAVESVTILGVMPKSNFNASPAALVGLPAPLRLAGALLAPPVGAILLVSLVLLLRPIDSADGRSANVLLLGSVGLISLLLGTAWYGLGGLGLRGKRPLYAGIGFAAMLWVVFIIARFVWVLNMNFGTVGGTREFVYLLLFEAFAVQLWTFGLFFRALADWRGPLTAAIGSGILFGVIGFLFFEESFFSNPPNLVSLAFFLVWGLFYGIIRLRTGSLVGIVVIQAMQSFTAWVVMVPANIPPDLAAMQTVYTVSAIACLLFIWRLWPKEVADYRV
jgi:membrane protease YdiL (CAAX protease family)